METNTEKAKSDMRRGTLEFCTLLIIARGRAYASDIGAALKEADVLVVEGTLYPLLNRLAREGTITHEWQESESGPPRKYYTLTKKGHTELAQLRAAWLELRGSIDTLIKDAHISQ
jgi:PadR family transcriptional regulator PadR